MGQDEQDELHWHAMNYRTAELKHANEMWLALEAFVARRIAEAVAAERERCAMLCLEVSERAWSKWKTDADPTDQGISIGADACEASIRVTPNDRTQSIDQD